MNMRGLSILSFFFFPFWINVYAGNALQDDIYISRFLVKERQYHHEKNFRDDIYVNPSAPSTSEISDKEYNNYKGDLAKAVSHILSGQLYRAEEIWANIRKKFIKEHGAYTNVSDVLRPYWQISECMMLNTKGHRDDPKKVVDTPYDPWAAYKMLRENTNSTDRLSGLNEFLAHKKIGLSVSAVKDSIESNLISMVDMVGTETEYDRLIATLYSYPNIQKIKQKRETVAFRSIIRSESVAECKRYMDKYGNMDLAHSKAISERRDSLAYVQLAATSSACEKYLQEYNDSRFRKEVTLLMYKYAFNELTPTEKACKEYIRKYPSSNYCEKVRELQEEYAFKEAKQESSINAFQTYLNSYPQSKYFQEALSLLDATFLRKYFNSSTTLADLQYFAQHENWNDSEGGKQLCALLSNIQNLPSSIAESDCNGIWGDVNINTYIAETSTSYDEKFEINEQGLITKYYNSRSNRELQYKYLFDDVHGWQLTSRTDEKGHTITYQYLYDEAGLIKELRVSDGSRLAFSYNGFNVRTITHFKGNSITAVDSYNQLRQMIKSVKGSITINYEYNDEGDVVSMNKKRGSAVLEATSYEYEYDDGVWTSMKQYHNGSFFLSKQRHGYWKTFHSSQLNGMSAMVQH